MNTKIFVALFAILLLASLAVASASPNRRFGGYGGYPGGYGGYPGGYGGSYSNAYARANSGSFGYYG